MAASLIKQEIRGTVYFNVNEKFRTNYTIEQNIELEKLYMIHPYLNYPMKLYLVNKFSIPDEKIKRWFQNRRSQDKISGEKRIHIYWCNTESKKFEHPAICHKDCRLHEGSRAGITCLYADDYDFKVAASHTESYIMFK